MHFLHMWTFRFFSYELLLHHRRNLPAQHRRQNSIEESPFAYTIMLSLLASSASGFAPGVSVPHTGLRVRSPSLAMDSSLAVQGEAQPHPVEQDRAWTFRHGHAFTGGRNAPLGGPRAWESSLEGEPRNIFKSENSPEETFRHGAGRKMPVPLGGPRAWESEDAPPMDVNRFSNQADQFRHGAGRKTPVPLGGPRAWEGTEAPPMDVNRFSNQADQFRHGIEARKTPVPLGGPRAWEATDAPPADVNRFPNQGDQFRHGVGPKTPQATGGINPF